MLKITKNILSKPNLILPSKKISIIVPSVLKYNKRNNFSSIKLSSIKNHKFKTQIISTTDQTSKINKKKKKKKATLI